MIRSAKLFETAGHQLLVCVTVFDCSCDKPECPGSVLGVRVQTVGTFPKGEALVQGDCVLPIDLRSISVVIEALKQKHAQQLLEIVQSTGYDLRSDDNARKAIGKVMLQALADCG